MFFSPVNTSRVQCRKCLMRLRTPELQHTDSISTNAHRDYEVPRQRNTCTAKVRQPSWVPKGKGPSSPANTPTSSTS